MANASSGTLAKTANSSTRRVAMFVANNMVNDRRVMREASTVAAAGFEVTVHALIRKSATLPEAESRPGGYAIVRHRIGIFPPLLPIKPALLSLILHPFWCAFVLGAKLARKARLPLSSGAMLAATWGSWAILASRASRGTDILHAHDLSGAIPALLALRQNPQAILVYDSHEVFLESGRWATVSARLRSLIGSWVEQPVLRQSAALITVNPSVERVLAERYALPSRRVVVYNCVDPLESVSRPRELRDAIGVSDSAPVAMYHGVLSPVRGLRQIVEAAKDPRLSDVHFVFLGNGPMESELRTISSDPVFAGRIHVLDSVVPEVLERWIAGADVGLMPNQHESLNEYVSTPNKLFESIGAGTPVVSSDFPERRRIVLNEPFGPLGALCDPADPADIARAIHQVVGGNVEHREAFRHRCRTAAQSRWNWSAQAEQIRALYGSFVPTTGAEGDPTARLSRTQISAEAPRRPAR